MKALSDTVIFRFKEKVVNGKFVGAAQYNGTLYIPSTVEDSAKSARYADVIAVGPDVTSVKPGDVVVIEPLMWGDRHEFNGLPFWKTIEKHIIAVEE